MLVIEDGTQVAGANSFTTDAEFLAHAAARGVTLPSTEAERDVLQIKAVDYLISKESKSRFKGSRVSGTQGLPYPRVGVSVRGFDVASDEIPPDLKKAQLEAGISANSHALLVTGKVSNIKRKKTDVLETEYSGDGGRWDTVRLENVDVYLRPLLSTNMFNEVRRG